MKSKRRSQRRRHQLAQPVRWAEIFPDPAPVLRPNDPTGAPLESAKTVLAGSADETAIAWTLGNYGVYELWAGRAPLVRYRYAGLARGGYLLAEVETAEGRWSLKAPNHLASSYLAVTPVAHPGGPADLAVRRDWRHRWMLTPKEGQALRWQPAGLASADWVCLDPDGATIARMVASWDEAANVELAPAARDLSGLPLILAVGWHLLLRYRNPVGVE